MTFVKGKSGNPAGRPPSERALAGKVAAALSKRITDADGKARPGADVLAQVLVNLALTGQSGLPGGQTLTVSARDQLDAMKFVLTHLDGPARATIDVEGNVASAVTITTRRLAGVDPGPVSGAG